MRNRINQRLLRIKEQDTYMKKIICILLIIISIVPLNACIPNSARASMEAMDTYMSFELNGANSSYAIDGVKNKVKKKKKNLSAVSSGEIALLNKNGRSTLGVDTLDLLNRSLELCAQLNGALDISVYPLVREWGFIDGKYKVPDKSKISKLLTLVDYTKIKVNNNTVSLEDGIQLDLGAVAKGFAADKCREILESEGINSAILNFGGTVETFGTKPGGEKWKVAVTDPDNPSLYFGYLGLNNAVIATSGGYQRYFEKDGKKYIHIIDPDTGYPVDNGVKSVTVISNDGVFADALSTALYVMGADNAVRYQKSHKSFDVIILTDDNKMYISDGIADSFTLVDGYDYEVEVIN